MASMRRTIRRHMARNPKNVRVKKRVIKAWRKRRAAA